MDEEIKLSLAFYKFNVVTVSDQLNISVEIQTQFYSVKDNQLLLVVDSSVVLPTKIDTYIIENHVFLFLFEVLSNNVLNSEADSKWGVFNEVEYHRLMNAGLTHLFNIFNNSDDFDPGKKEYYSLPNMYIENRGINIYYPITKVTEKIDNMKFLE